MQHVCTDLRFHLETVGKARKKVLRSTSFKIRFSTTISACAVNQLSIRKLNKCQTELQDNKNNTMVAWILLRIHWLPSYSKSATISLWIPWKASWPVERTPKENFRLTKLLKTESGLCWRTRSWFLERDPATEFFKCIFYLFISVLSTTSEKLSFFIILEIRRTCRKNSRYHNSLATHTTTA